MACAPSTTESIVGQILDARGDPAVVLADAEDVVTGVRALLHAALDPPRRPDGDADPGHDQPDGALGAGDGGDIGSGQQFWAATT